ncbi:MAG TPA: polymer-forming cytoskeletal protein [Gemmatimonadaceae bacterium]|nr:polymer-forming cytoskeletal protein [Gemmatimonadaceae bacterium]
MVLSPPRLLARGALAFALLAASAHAAGAQERSSASAALQQRLDRIAAHPLGLPMPPADSIIAGGRVVEAGERLSGRIATSGGPLDVSGTIDGDAIAIDGDVIVREGGVVRGQALAVGGRVRLEGGVVEGDARSLSAVGSATAADAPPVSRSPMEATRRALGLAAGWLLMLAIIGIGVLMFAGSHLQAVEEELERRFSRAFWVGLVGQLAIAPVLLLLIVGLALTVIGILLIPFAIVAYALLLAGLLTLGFLAVARRTGEAILRPSTDGLRAERRARLRTLMMGLVFYVGLWLLAAAFTWSPMAGGALRGLAAVVTWVALTAGLGATLLTRAGTRVARLDSTPIATTDEIAWSTPTPVTGVAAARRPTPVHARERP